MKRRLAFTMSFVAVFLLVASLWAQDTLISAYVPGELPLDPTSQVWNKARPVTTDLHGQIMAPPIHPQPSVTSVTVKSLNNGKEIAYLLVWQDPTENRFHSLNEFSDAVAVQVPYSPNAAVPITMGGPGQRVLILHWAAFRQENIDRRYFDTEKAYPNYTYDWYPHAEPPYKYPENWHSPYALNYIGGEKVLRKNTLKTPVREVVAEGPGTSTWKDIQGASGQGVYQDGRWSVVIKRKFVEENTSNPDWGAGKSTFASFAVWDGANNERGGRKSLEYAWTPLKIQEK